MDKSKLLGAVEYYRDSCLYHQHCIRDEWENVHNAEDFVKEAYESLCSVIDNMEEK